MRPCPGQNRFAARRRYTALDHAGDLAGVPGEDLPAAEEPP
jgi:hypothetical protein